jgi:hypothetical protein
MYKASANSEKMLKSEDFPDTLEQKPIESRWVNALNKPVNKPVGYRTVANAGSGCGTLKHNNKKNKGGTPILPTTAPNGFQSDWPNMTPDPNLAPRSPTVGNGFSITDLTKNTQQKSNSKLSPELKAIVSLVY